MKIAFVQKDNGDWLNENCYSAAQGFKALGYEVRSFERHELERLPLQKDGETILHGGINTVRATFDLLEVPQPDIHHAHLLVEFCERNFMVSTMGQLRAGKFPFPIFIKPYVDHKLFTGLVAKDPLISIMRLGQIENNVQILLSDVLDIVSEYRVFVRQGKIVGAKNYSGDYSLVPNFHIIEDAVKTYTREDAPAAYSLDWAVTKTGRTALIEINDGFGLGTYGLNSMTYAKMIIARWREIMGLHLHIAELG